MKSSKQSTTAPAGRTQASSLIARRTGAVKVSLVTSEPAPEQEFGDEAEPRRRLLDAATRIFGRDGYHHASVREITDAAGVNVAGVRYYFGSKLDLYREVLLTNHRELLAQHPMPERRAGEDPATALHRWVKHLLEMILLPGRCRSRMGKIMVFEMVQPTPALDDVVALIIRPVHEAVREIVDELTGRSVSGETVQQLCHCIVANCVVWDDHREILMRLGMPIPSSGLAIDELAEVLATFAAGGLMAVGRQRVQKKRKER